jgi:hypothetical protein
MPRNGLRPSRNAVAVRRDGSMKLPPAVRTIRPNHAAAVSAGKKPKPRADKTIKKFAKALRKDAKDSSPKFKDKI